MNRKKKHCTNHNLFLTIKFHENLNILCVCCPPLVRLDAEVDEGGEEKDEEDGHHPHPPLKAASHFELAVLSVLHRPEQKISTSRFYKCQTHLITVFENPASLRTILFCPLISLDLPLKYLPLKILWQPTPVCWTAATFLIPPLCFSFLFGASWKFFAVPAT